MIVEIVDFKPEHLEQMVMREHEASMTIDGQPLLKDSIESKTVFVDGEVICCYGIFSNNGLWQIPSVNIMKLPVKYARETIKIVRKLIKGKLGVHSWCVDDEFHKRWMGFIGFQPTEDTMELEGNLCRLYVVNGN